ncbi:3'-5' exonuclease [Neisseriaceae bacterium B1]
MATFIPPFNQLNEHLTNAAERNVAKYLHKYLPDDCVVYCNIPIGKKHQYADFLILFPNKGLLCLEVKDWKLETLHSMNKLDCSLMIKGTEVKQAHPLQQARGYALNVVNTLIQDKRLVQQNGDYKGKLIFPYSYGVVFTHFSRPEIIQKLGDYLAEFDNSTPLRYTLYKNDIALTETQPSVLRRLHAMFDKNFPCQLNQEQIDRIRWHLFPEIRINLPMQQSLFDEAEASDNNNTFRQPEKQTEEIKPITQIPDIIKAMDIQQETTARMMGGGHRVIHGVAGSGKTLILALRAQVLAERTEKPILILCYNITLAAKLRAVMAEKGLSDKVQVQHFHGWCAQLITQHNIALNADEKRVPYYEGSVLAAIRASEQGDIPPEQYGAILIDEGHDFQADWLRLAIKMLDKTENHLLLLYDDAQSIYPNQRNQKGIKFSLSSVGIEARGRTVKLANNYRNTKEIIGFAHIFAQQNLRNQESDEDNIPVVEPCATGENGKPPHIKRCDTWQDELTYLERCLKKWLPEMPLQDLAIICATKDQCEEVCQLLTRLKLDYWALHKTHNRKKYDPKRQKITVIPIPSSKGLEFQRVILMGTSELSRNRQQNNDPTRLIYVGMTRAQTLLVITLSGNNVITQHIEDSFKQWQAFQAA